MDTNSAVAYWDPSQDNRSRYSKLGLTERQRIEGRLYLDPSGCFYLVTPSSDQQRISHKEAACWLLANGYPLPPSIASYAPIDAYHSYRGSYDIENIILVQGDEFLVINTSLALQSWRDKVDHNGEEFVFRSTQSKWAEGTLYLGPSGLYYLVSSNVLFTKAHYLSRAEAARWLLINDYDLPEDLEPEAPIDAYDKNNKDKGKGDRVAVLYHERFGVVCPALALRSWQPANDSTFHNDSLKEVLYLGPSGRYYTVRYPLHPLSTEFPAAQYIDPLDAAFWLIQNNHPLPDDLQYLVNGVSNIKNSARSR